MFNLYLKLIHIIELKRKFWDKIKSIKKLQESFFIHLINLFIYITPKLLFMKKQYLIK